MASNSIEILKERLARGEIDQSEFDALYAKLTETKVEPSSIAVEPEKTSDPVAAFNEAHAEKSGNNDLSKTLMGIGGFGIAFILFAIFSFEKGTTLNSNGVVILLISAGLFLAGLLTRSKGD